MGETVKKYSICDYYNDCDMLTEKGKPIACEKEATSRLLYGRYIPPNASVLEVGARYGQTTCALPHLLREEGKLTSVEADPRVWGALEANLLRKECRFDRFNLVKGVVGQKPKMIIKSRDPYGTSTQPYDSVRHANPDQVVAPAHPLSTLKGPFDTLCIDCEGCFKSFLRENPELLRTVKLIIVDIHNRAEEQQMVSLLSSGQWKKVDVRAKDFVLCASSSLCPMQDSDC